MFETENQVTFSGEDHKWWPHNSEIWKQIMTELILLQTAKQKDFIMLHQNYHEKNLLTENWRKFSTK